jgi:hypothetical protein
MIRARQNDGAFDLRLWTVGPPAVTSRAYTRDFDEVKRLGSATSTVRTADQTDAALWWHDRRSVSWGMKRALAVTQGLSVLETARFHALADFTGTDGAVACANDKEFWHSDPDWTPLQQLLAGDHRSRRSTHLGRHPALGTRSGCPRSAPAPILARV